VNEKVQSRTALRTEPQSGFVGRDSSDLDDKSQVSLFEKNQTPAVDKEQARRALDDLFNLARKYKSGKEYAELLRFVARFRFYSPYNAMLVHIQRPGSTFVAPAHRWLKQFQHRIKLGAQPLVILQPMGPLMFVFDVSDTEPLQGAPPLPDEVMRPFEVRKGHVSQELGLTIENGKRDGVLIAERSSGSQAAGCIREAKPGAFQDVVKKLKPAIEYVRVAVRYEVLLTKEASRETNYATLVHELAHLYCGHLGSPNKAWWPDRQGLPKQEEEFEAESSSFLVCERLGVETRSDKYLAGYLGGENNHEVPNISLERVMKAAGLIEQMGGALLRPRKEKEK
jgi:hypothetical protein